MTRQFYNALKANDIHTVSSLINAKKIDVNAPLHSLDKTALQWVLREGTVEMLHILLDAPGLEIDGMKPGWTSSALLCAISSNRSDMVKELLKDVRVNINNLFLRGRAFKVTPIMHAFYEQSFKEEPDTTIFSILLENPSIDIHRKMNICGRSYPTLLHALWEDVHFMHPNRVFIPILVRHYCRLMVTDREIIQSLFQIYDDLPEKLSNYRTQVWEELKKQEKRLSREQYLDLLKKIDSSSTKPKSMPHPFYTIFSIKESLTGQFYRFFNNEKQELQKIKEKISMLELGSWHNSLHSGFRPMPIGG